jgi:hypothetical protein
LANKDWFLSVCAQESIGFWKEIMTDIITEDFLNDMHIQADPELDILVHKAGDCTEGIKRITTMFKHVHSSQRLTRSGLDRMLEREIITPEIVGFFANNDSVPDKSWFDPAKLRAGGQFYRDRGVLGFLSLACASLPACYCWSDEAYLLGTTGRLQNSDEVPRRLPETATFVLDVARENAFGSNGTAIEASHKVRLMHSIIRYLVVSKQATIDSGANSEIARLTVSNLTDTVFGHNWKKRFGPPISQELLIGTLLTFSYVVLNGFDRMGVHVSKEEQEAYLHRWNVVGYFLGLDERMLANLNTMEEAEAMFELVMDRNRKTSPDGPKLEQALLDFMRINLAEHFLHGFGGRLVIVPKILTFKLAGKETCESLSLKLGFLGTVLRPFVWGGVKLVGHMNNLRSIQIMTRWLINYVVKSIWGWRVVTDDGTDDDGPPPVIERNIGIAVHESLARHWGMTK